MIKKLKAAPLSGPFMATSMLGILISIMYVFPKSLPWGLAFTLTFSIMFISAMVSMSHADPDAFIKLEAKK